jgi:GntR family transcriptional regulator/MocR family aminotransferase
LRQAIADYLFRARAISCKAEQVIIVGGAQQGLNLITKLHVNSGDQVAIEDPGYIGAQYTFQSYGAQLWPIPVDDHGLDVDTLEALGSVKFKLIYATPTHQAPLGPTLSLSRRLKLIHWAQKTGAMIAEDDYDGEYRYAGRPIPALAAMDNRGCVLYIGSFSKVLFPSLRLGYLVVPETLVDTYTWAKKLEDNYTPILEQAVLADFMSSGSFDRYIRRMSKIYARKRHRLVKSLQEHFAKQVEILGESAGLSLAVRFKTGLEDKTIIDKLAKLGIGINTTSRYYLADKYTKGEFFLAYSDLDEDAIEEGVKRIARVIISDTESGQL